VLLAPSFAIAAHPEVLERRPSLAAIGSRVIALVHSGTGLSDSLRDITLTYVGIEPPLELEMLNQRLSNSARQHDGSLAVAPGSVWVLWGEDAFSPTQSPATLAFLLPSSEAP
jgi:hypothetical protein